MATGEPPGLQAKAFALLDLPPKRRVGDRLAEWMARIAPADADPGLSRLVKFRHVRFRQVFPPPHSWMPASSPPVHRR